MKPDQITVDDVIRFAEENEGRPFFTLARGSAFTIGLTKVGIKYLLPSGSYYPVNRELIGEYLKDYNTSALGERELTTIYSGTKFESSYIARTLSEIRNERALRERFDEEREILGAPETMRRALFLARVGQGQFRDDCLATQSGCYVTGIKDSRFLRASHIKAWKDSTNEERLDRHNGLLLSPTYDHLFDRHLISFEDDGQIIVSLAVPANVIKALRIDVGVRGRAFSGETRAYLAVHRGELRRLEMLFTTGSGATGIVATARRKKKAVKSKDKRRGRRRSRFKTVDNQGTVVERVRNRYED